MLIVAAILAIFVYGVVAAMLGTLMPTFTFLSMEQKGTVALAQAVGLIIASISVGPLIDNKGKKTGLVLGLALIAIALWALPSAGAFVPILALLLLLGLGGGIIVTAANTLVSDISPERRGSVMNFLNLFFGLGGLATPFIAANVVDRDPVRLCYLAAGLTTVTLVVHIATKMPPPSGERGFKFSEASDVLGKPTLYLLALFLFLYVAAEVGVWNWLASYLIGQGIPEPRALNILSLGFALGMLVGRVAVSPVLMKVRPATVTLGAAVLMAITTYLMLQSNDPTLAGVAVFCAGLAMAPVFPTTLAMVGDAFPKGTATAMGIVITCGWIGLAVSSPIIGGIAGAGSANLKTALLVLPAVSVMMIAVNLVLRPMLKKAA
ncbi:MAG: MFS transporter [Bryobacterales bacterium]|nr:MFS transporter [Bryobacterales bacterium]